MTDALLVNFGAHQAQSDAYRAWQPGCRIGNAWGRGTGKSWFARRLMYLDVAAWDGVERQTAEGPMRGVRIFYMFPTLKHFRRLGHAKNMLDELSPGGRFGFLGARINQSEWIFTFPGGSSISVLTAEASNRGARADVAVLDEADEIDISTYESEIGPWFTEPWSFKKRLITGTPKRGRFGLLWKAFSVWPNGDVNHPPADNAYGFHATVFEADSSIVDRSEAEEARRTINPIRFSTEYECNFDSAEGLVYPAFDAAFHVRTPPSFSHFHSYIVGVDYGFNDPTVMLVIGIAGSGADTICHVLREVYVTGKAASELVPYAAQLESAFPGAKWYADHDPAKTKTLHDDAGVKIVSAEKGSVEDGASVVTDALWIREDDDGRRWAQLYVDPSCKHTIDEFGKYKRKRDSKNIDRVLDEIDTSVDDHCMDALRYALVSHFVGPGKRIERQQKLR